MRFCVTTLNGKEYFSMEHHDHGDSKEPRLGTMKRFPLSEEQASLGLGKLISLYKAAALAAEEKEKALKSEMIDFLRNTITKSREENEVQLALQQYKKLTGVEFRL